MIECYKKLDLTERNELFDIVSEYGYDLYLLDNFEMFNRLEKIEREDMSNQKHFEILAVHKSKPIGE